MTADEGPAWLLVVVTDTAELLADAEEVSLDGCFFDLISTTVDKHISRRVQGRRHEVDWGGQVHVATGWTCPRRHGLDMSTTPRGGHVHVATGWTCPRRHGVDMSTSPRCGHVHVATGWTGVDMSTSPRDGHVHVATRWTCPRHHGVDMSTSPRSGLR